MGIGGNFWDLLKPFAKHEGPDAIRDQKVAVDLSFWIVQQETALSHSNSHVSKSHLRVLFFRIINLFSKYGAYPVFVIDGAPSHLKCQARISRFFRGVDAPPPPVAELGVPVERNKTFLKRVRECVGLIELFGMPVLKADGEAEALCAQLNREGHVDACITADSDVFLFGANRVIKSINPNTKEPFECYYMSDVEANLALKRNHLIAISLLVGNDLNLKGVPGIGIDSALRFVGMFDDDEILAKLRAFGNGEESDLNVAASRSITKPSHCTHCGHPGTRKAHTKLSCQYCGTVDGEGCTEKPSGFHCCCSFCEEHLMAKTKKKSDDWKLKVCRKIRMEPNFPNMEIIELYLRSNNRSQSDGELSLSWRDPKVQTMTDFFVFHGIFEPAYVRRKMIPVFSTMFFRKMATMKTEDLLYDQYKFHSIKSLKVRYGQEKLRILWRKETPLVKDFVDVINVEEDDEQGEIPAIDEREALDGESGCFLLTEENLELVRAAFPEEVREFLNNKGAPKRRRSCDAENAQLQITEFFRTAKPSRKSKDGDSGPKSARRRLMFD